jgi:chaperonin GroEL (HSP60 family)
LLTSLITSPPTKALILLTLQGAVVVGRLLEDAKGNVGTSRGMNSYTGEYCDMVEMGIIDPTKVRISLFSICFLASTSV